MHAMLPNDEQLLRILNMICPVLDLSLLNQEGPDATVSNKSSRIHTNSPCFSQMGVQIFCKVPPRGQQNPHTYHQHHLHYLGWKRTFGKFEALKLDLVQHLLLFPFNVEIVFQGTILSWYISIIVLRQLQLVGEHLFSIGAQPAKVYVYVQHTCHPSAVGNEDCDKVIAQGCQPAL